MNNKAILAIILISTLLILSGCGSKECSTKADCKTQGSCQIASCVKSKCILTTKPGCTCGDAKCDKTTENPCNCPEDCKPACKGTVGKYLEKSCDQKQNCVTTVSETKKEKPENIAETIELSDGRNTIASLIANYKYDVPFNIYSSLFNINVKIDKKQDSITSMTIKKVKIIQHTGTYDQKTKTWKNDQINTLAEKDYNRQLWNEQTEFSDKFPITFEDAIQNGSLSTSLWAVIELEYVITDTKGNTKTTSYENSKELTFELVAPTEEKKCPDKTEWDYSNPCMTPKCSAETGYFVDFDVKKGCKGNYICETGENGCNAPTDCEPCEKSIGQYLERTCYNLECKTKIKDGAIIETTTMPDTRTMGVATFLVRVSFNKPFNIKKDKFSINFEAQKLPGIQGFTITTVQIIDKGKTQSLIVDQKVDIAFPTEGSTQTITLPPLDQVSTSVIGEDTRRPSLKVFFKYSVQQKDGTLQDTLSSYEYDLGDLTFINPEVDI